MNNLNYGIIGNCRTTALVSDKGSIDWCCMPYFNSSSVFTKIIDKDKGGSFEIITDKTYKISQSYIIRTNILVTKYKNQKSCFEVIDFMPRYTEGINTYYAPPDIIRYIKCISGTPVLNIKYDPRLEYARYPTKTIVEEKYIKSFTSKGTYDSIYLYTNLDKEKIVNGEKIRIYSDSFFLLSYNQKILDQTIEREYLNLQRTKVYWLNWSERTKHFVRYNNEILRSALVLKLLSYDKTGAIIAAVTTSLPETIGEIRNWDYRFCWIRDSSMVIKVLTNLGHFNVAMRYVDFILKMVSDKDEKIQIMYGINGEKKLKEKILSHLFGYEGSEPVRIGNDAYRQKQNDIYGVLMDLIYQQFILFDTSVEISEALWTLVRSIVRTVEKNWRKPDRGIWEFRTQPRHFTFSKVLCWAAVDRGIKIAEILQQDKYISEWSYLRNRIKTNILKNAWNNKINAFTQYYGSDDMDASNLLMESYGFIDAKDEKYINTVKATKKHLCYDGLMYRYKNTDDFGLPSSSFTVCTFWLIQSLLKIGERKEAENLFNKLLSYSNHLGLFSEDIDFKSKRLLGNYPQAYSHLTLIETAINLAEGTIVDEHEILEAIHIEKKNIK